MARKGLAVGLVAAMALAGCMGAADDPAGEDLAGASVPLPEPAVPRVLAMHGCEDHVGIILIPIAGDPVQALPEGFRHMPVDPAGLLTAHAMFGWSCRAASADGAFEADGLGGLMAMLLVDPPDAYEEDGIDFYAVPILAAWVDRAEAAALLQAWRRGVAAW